MNEQQQPKEYIITKEVLYNKCYLHGFNRKVWETMDPVVFSRPHPAPQAPEPMLQDGDDPEEICKRKPICAHYPCGMEKADSYCGMKLRLADVVSKEHDAAIERKAREVFATTLKKRLRKTWEDAKEMSDDPEWEENHSFSLLYLENEIDESLRQQESGQEQPR